MFPILRALASGVTIGAIVDADAANAFSLGPEATTVAFSLIAQAALLALLALVWKER